MRRVVLPMTLRLLRSMADTAIRGFSSPLIAIGMAMKLQRPEKRRFWRIFLFTSVASFRKSRIWVRSPRIRVIPPASLRRSFPEEMPMPRSAWARARAGYDENGETAEEGSFHG